MYGWHVRALFVHVHHNNNERTLVFEKYHNRDTEVNAWHEASLDVTLASGDQLEFTGERGKEYSGDIGLDRIRLRPTAC